MNATRAGSLVLDAPPRDVDVRRLLASTARKLGVLHPVHMVVGGRVWLPRALTLPGVRVTTDATSTAPLRTVRHTTKLWPHQAAASRAIGQRSGVVVMPCGSGKTTLAIAKLAEWRQRALVLVHTRDLLTQWVARLGVELAGVTVGEGKTSTADVVVCTVQQLALCSPEWLAAWGRRFGTLIADESHRAAARTWTHVVASIPARNRLSMTATPEREDDGWPLVEAHFGPVLHRVREAELVKAGRVLKPSVRCVITRRSDEAIPVEEDPRRNSQIVHIVRRLVEVEDRTVVVLVRRVVHAGYLAARLASYVSSSALHGEMTGTEREEVLAALRAGRLRAVVATSLLDEAVDVPSVDTIVLAAPTAVLARVEQRIGRATRAARGKQQPLVVDLCDAHHVASASKRESWYESRGYQVSIVS